MEDNEKEFWEKEFWGLPEKTTIPADPENGILKPIIVRRHELICRNCGAKSYLMMPSEEVPETIYIKSCEECENVHKSEENQNN